LLLVEDGGIKERLPALPQRVAGVPRLSVIAEGTRVSAFKRLWVQAAAESINLLCSDRFSWACLRNSVLGKIGSLHL